MHTRKPCMHTHTRKPCTHAGHAHTRLEGRRELARDVTVELLREERRHELAALQRPQRAARLGHVLTLEQRAHDGCVRAAGRRREGRVRGA
eukprot:4854338-Prymnesium_polylepis.1